MLPWCQEMLPGERQQRSKDSHIQHFSCTSTHKENRHIFKRYWLREQIYRLSHICYKEILWKSWLYYVTIKLRVFYSFVALPQIVCNYHSFIIPLFPNRGFKVNIRTYQIFIWLMLLNGKGRNIVSFIMSHSTNVLIMCSCNKKCGILYYEY